MEEMPPRTEHLEVLCAGTGTPARPAAEHSAMLAMHRRLLMRAADSRAAPGARDGSSRSSARGASVGPTPAASTWGSRRGTRC